MRGIIITKLGQIVARTAIADEPGNRATLDAVIAQFPDAQVEEITDSDPRWNTLFNDKAINTERDAYKDRIKQRWAAVKLLTAQEQINFLAGVLGLEPLALPVGTAGK